MAGIPQVTTQDATGVPASPSTDIPSRIAVIGAAYQGTLNTVFRAKRKPIVEDYLEGPLVRAATTCYDGARLPLITQRCEASNPGTYDTIDNSGVTGTARGAVVSTAVPRNECELYIEIVDGGTVGTTGITYYTSTENGRIAKSGLKRLGTLTRITFGNTGCEFELDPPEAPLVAFLVDVRAMTIDHFAETPGVHGAADATSGVGIPGAPTNFATAKTCLIALVAAAKLHVVNLASSIHGAADNTALAALNAIEVDSGSTNQEVLTAALEYVDAMFGDGATTNDAHTLRIAGTVHGAEDLTNVITATVPSPGTLVAGDIIRCTTSAPYPSADELADAFETLAKSAYTPGIVLLAGRTPAAYASTISAGLDLLQDNGKPVRCIVQARQANEESQQDLRDTLENEWGTNVINDDRILVAATDTLCTLSDGSATRIVPAQRFTGFAANFAVRRLKKPFYETTWQPADGFLDGVTLVDADGVIVGHDEPAGITTRLQVLYQAPSAQDGRPTVASVDYVLAGEEDRIKEFRVGLIRDEIDRSMRSFSWNQIGTLVWVTVTSPTTGILNEDKRQDLIRRAAAILQRNPGLQQGIADIEAPDLVSLESDVAIDGANVYLEFTVNWTPTAAIGRINTTHSVRTGS